MEKALEEFSRLSNSLSPRKDGIGVVMARPIQEDIKSAIKLHGALHTLVFLQSMRFMISKEEAAVITPELIARMGFVLGQTLMHYNDTIVNMHAKYKHA